MTLREYVRSLFSREGWRAIVEFWSAISLWRLFGNRDDW